MHFQATNILNCSHQPKPTKYNGKNQQPRPLVHSKMAWERKPELIRERERERESQKSERERERRREKLIKKKKRERSLT